MCLSVSASMRHIQNTYMYSVLGLPGDFDGNGAICFVDKHSRKYDLNFVCSYSRLAGLLPYAKSVANAIEYTPQSESLS